MSSEHRVRWEGAAVFFQLVSGIGLVAVTVLIHGSVLGWLLGRLRRVEPVRSFWRESRVLIGVAVVCILAHLFEITLWAAFYLWQGVVPDSAVAGYLSAVTYATIGYGDVVPPEEWRLLASMEGLVGILMCAWSGGFFFAVVMRLQGTSMSPDRTPGDEPSHGSPP